MKRRKVLTVAASIAAPCLLSDQAHAAARRIGVVYPQAPAGGPPPGATQAWRSLGWIEGDSLIIERRYAAWRTERMPELVDELLRRQGVELLITFGPEAAAAAARATREIPIVFAWAYLPIECGLVDSYARPGRNCTGIAISAGIEVAAKRIEFIRAIAPTARRMTFLSTDTGQMTVSGKPLEVMWADSLAAAKGAGFEPAVHLARRIEDVENALHQAAATRAEVANIVGYPYVAAAPSVVAFALQQRWPTSTFAPEMFEAGLLLYHGPSIVGNPYPLERLAKMVDQILRGAAPADIPVELPARIELALNLRTARALGLTLSRTMLLRADRLVE